MLTETLVDEMYKFIKKLNMSKKADYKPNIPSLHFTFKMSVNVYDNAAAIFDMNPNVADIIRSGEREMVITF